MPRFREQRHRAGSGRLEPWAGMREQDSKQVEAAARRIERVLWNDPATGVMRHADAGYPIAIDCAREHALDLPGLDAG
jgi:hypothetical protein